MIRASVDFGTKPLSRPEAHLVLLAGSSLVFTDRLIFLLLGEFPAFEFLRASEPDLDSGRMARRPHLVICEACGAPEPARRVIDAGVPLGVAYQDVAMMADWLVALDRDDKVDGLSLLPMNLRLDAWLSVVALLLSGETYAPAPALREYDRRRLKPGGVEGADASRPGAPAAVLLDRLTERERAVLPLVAEGKQNKVIASELGMSEHTVKLHVHHIIDKLGVHNRTEATRLYLSGART